MMITNFDQKGVINKNQYIVLYRHMLIPATHFKEFDYCVNFISKKKRSLLAKCISKCLLWPLSTFKTLILLCLCLMKGGEPWKHQ